MTPLHSFGATIARRNGKSEVVCAEKSVKAKLEESLNLISQQQTDLRYLQNLRLFLPEKIGKHHLNKPRAIRKDRII